MIRIIKDRGGKELNTMNTFYDLYFAQSFQNGASTAEPFQQELDNPVGEVCKEHEGETKLFVFVSVFVFVFVFLITGKEQEGESSEKPTKLFVFVFVSVFYVSFLFICICICLCIFDHLQRT